MLTLSIGTSLCVGLPGCRRTPPTVIVVPGDARVVRQLENGNFEVTPGFLLERARYEAELEAALERCRESK